MGEVGFAVRRDRGDGDGIPSVQGDGGGGRSSSTNGGGGVVGFLQGPLAAVGVQEGLRGPSRRRRPRRARQIIQGTDVVVCSRIGAGSDAFVRAIGGDQESERERGRGSASCRRVCFFGRG